MRETRPAKTLMPPPARELNWQSVSYQMILLLGFFGLLYGRIVANLMCEWWALEEASHGFLVLPIVSFILFANREKLRQLPVEPGCKAGYVLTSAAALLLVLGEIGGILVMSQVSMLIMLGGIVLTLLGVHFLAALSFPLSYLLFMMPSLGGTILAWNWQFQLITARMGVFFLQLMGIPAQLDGNHIILPTIILRVASSCSGARYLIAILALALPIGYVILKRLRYRVALTALAIIIGIAANWLRVVLIGLWAFSGGKVVHGPFHILQALSVAWVAFAGLFMVAWTLSRMEARKGESLVTGVEPKPRAARPAGEVARAWNHAWALTVLLSLAAAGYLCFYHRGPVPLKQNLAAFPHMIGQWVESQEKQEVPMLRAVGADEELHRTYVGPARQRFHVYMAYFEYQQQEKEAVSHLMAPFHRNAQTLLLTSSHAKPDANQALAANLVDKWQLLFWYDINGRILANRLTAQASIIWEALTQGRTNGAMVMIYSEIDTTSQELDSDLKNFALELLPVLRKFLP